MDLKKLKTWNFEKIILNFGTHARKLFQKILFPNLWTLPAPPMSDPTKVWVTTNALPSLSDGRHLFLLAISPPPPSMLHWSIPISHLC
jgi:hypothetical protein